MFIELHEKNTNNPILVRVSAINTITTEYKGRTTNPTGAVTVLVVGNERYEVVESYNKVFYMMMGYSYYEEEGVDNGGDSAE